jgi:type II restriction enzyme
LYSSGSQLTSVEERFDRLMQAVGRLPASQVTTIERIVAQFGQPQQYWAKPDSDLVSPAALDAFGDVLQLHHCFSEEPFSKDKFEYALVRVANSRRGHKEVVGSW